MSSATLAGPPGDCCTQTVQHVGEPRGAIEKIAGANTYITGPRQCDKIILFFADIFGPLYVNAQLVMDYWADNGELGRCLQTRHTDLR